MVRARSGLSPPGRVPGGQGYAYSGGDLNIVTPLLTGEASASMAYTAGGSLTLRRPQGAAALQAGALGAQLTLAGGSVDLDGAIALASGKLKIEAERDLRLGAQSRLDLAGREVVFYDQTRYTWGGDLTLDSASGNIDQEVGSVIDLSARSSAAARWPRRRWRRRRSDRPARFHSGRRVRPVRRRRHARAV